MSDITFKIDLNHPLFLIRRSVDGEIVTYTYELAPLWFSKDGTFYESAKYVDYCTVIVPLICFDTDAKRVQQAIDQTVSEALYQLTMKLMGKDARGIINNLRIFKKDDSTQTGYSFNQPAFIKFMESFWTAYPMFKVTNLIAKATEKGIERSLQVLNIIPQEPWFNENGQPLPAIPANNQVVFDVYEMHCQIEQLLSAGANIDEAQKCLKEMMIHSLIRELYVAKLKPQEQTTSAQIPRKQIQSTNLSEMLKNKIVRRNG